jgi:hypothetical protein
MHCTQLTDAAFVHLRGTKMLFMEGCSQPTITDAAFAHLRGIRTLVIDLCTQGTITGATFTSLAGIEALCMGGCSDEKIAAARFLGLPVPPLGLRSLGSCHCAFPPWRTPVAGPW